MARQFGSYSPAVPLGTTWDETLVLEDEHGDPIDITGLHVRAQLRAVLPVVVDGMPQTDPVLEFTTPDYYDSAPAWPTKEAFSVPEPTSGTIILHALPADFEVASPTNAKRKLRWSVVLTDKPSTDVAPVVSGRVLFLPATTV